MESSCEVTFLPYGKKIKVPTGTNLLRAANLVGIYLKSVCGGAGTCGKCELIVRQGDVTTRQAIPDAVGTL